LLIALYLILVIALPLALSSVVSYRTLPRTTTCPFCSTETLRLRSRWLQGISRLLRHQELQARWCTACLWEGTIRVHRRRQSARAGQHPGTARPERRRSIAVGPGQSGEAVSLRDLEIDGRAWRVLLQCWHDTDRWFGRLLFIAPTGRLWVDTVEPMSGSSSREVMGKALALPDRILAYRLRELISD
jgi:hypothetical protein